MKDNTPLFFAAIAWPRVNDPLHREPAASPGTSIPLFRPRPEHAAIVSRRKQRLDQESISRHPFLMDYRQIITIEPGKRSGKPCIRGMRITVTDVLEYLAGGMSIPEILADFPELTEEDIRACLAFAADRERRLSVIGG